jgi:hypothetical protein
MPGPSDTVGGRKLKDLDPKAFGKITPRARELTVNDLNYLAQFAVAGGQPPGKLADIDAEDLRSLEEAFYKARLQAADELAQKLDPSGVAAEDQEIFDNWSCCCCTPCCCCAAADVDPFA